jgi:hypothetical protein
VLGAATRLAVTPTTAAMAVVTWMEVHRRTAGNLTHIA